MKIYLAGPMRGKPYFNRSMFKAWTEMLRHEGHEVFSPLEEDIKRHGTRFTEENPAGSEEQAAQRFGFSIRDALGHDLAWICRHADAVALLPGWDKSKGATAEKATAEALGLELIYLGEPWDAPHGDVYE